MKKLIFMDVYGRRKQEVLSLPLVEEIAPLDEVDNPELLGALYQLDSHGCLDVGLGYVMSNKAPLEVQQLVRDTLLHGNSQDGRVDNPDDALNDIIPMSCQSGRDLENLSAKFVDYMKKLKDVE